MSISVKTFTFSLCGFVGGADEMNIIMVKETAIMENVTV